MGSESRKGLESEIRKVAERFRDVVEWQWDGRFGTALAEFTIEHRSSILGILEEVFACKWDSAGVTEAPDVVRKIAKGLGGLMSGQLLLVSDPDATPLVYCAWWPWGNGRTISIRIGLFTETIDAEKKGALTVALKAAFGVP